MPDSQTLHPLTPNLDLSESPENKGWFQRLLDNPHKKYVATMVAILAGLIAAITGVLVYVFYILIGPNVWTWSFYDWNSHTVWYEILLRILAGILLLAILGFIPLIPFLAVSGKVELIFKAFSDQYEQQFLKYERLRKEKENKYEEILLKESGNGLISSVIYSKVELDQYYIMGLKQAEKSYKSSIIAMWLGFTILATGILSFLFYPKVNSNVQLLTISSGIITEIVSGVFLVIYRSSKNQLSYFYSRQAFVHNTLLAYKIADSMSASKKDEGKKMIVAKILEFGMTGTPDDSDIAKKGSVKKPTKAKSN